MNPQNTLTHTQHDIPTHHRKTAIVEDILQICLETWNGSRCSCQFNYITSILWPNPPAIYNPCSLEYVGDRSICIVLWQVNKLNVCVCVSFFVCKAVQLLSVRVSFYKPTYVYIACVHAYVVQFRCRRSLSKVLYTVINKIVVYINSMHYLLHQYFICVSLHALFNQSCERKCFWNK